MSPRILKFLLLLVPAVLLLTGCSGGVNGEGTNNYPQTAGTPVVRANSFNDMGWNLITQGQLDSAVAQFNKVLADNPTDDERAEANNGLGWARSRLGSLVDGMTYFEKAIERSDDAKVGLAAGYIQKASKADLEQAVTLLYKKLGKENVHFHYTPRRPTGVSDAECHALLAFAYAGIGKADEAQAQLDYAKELSPEWASSTIDQVGRMVDFLNR